MSELETEPAQLPLERVFSTATARVMDFLLENDGFKYTESQLSTLAGVPSRTLQRSLQLLLDEELIKRSKKSGRTYNYTANLDSPRVVALLKYANSTILSNLDIMFEKNSQSKSMSVDGQKIHH